MPPQPHAQKLLKEGRLGLAIASFQSNPQLSMRQLSKAYNISNTTLQRRVRGIHPKYKARSPNRRLLLTEEQALVAWILDLDRRGFPPQIIDVRRMADVLVAARGEQPSPSSLDKLWVSRFIKAQPELQTKWNRKRNVQRALAEDPVTIQAWYQLIQDTYQEYGILDEDVYNFDETGFAIGIAAILKVVTSSNTVSRAVNI